MLVPGTRFSDSIGSKIKMGCNGKKFSNWFTVNDSSWKLKLIFRAHVRRKIYRTIRYFSICFMLISYHLNPIESIDCFASIKSTFSRFILWKCHPQNSFCHHDHISFIYIWCVKRFDYFQLHRRTIVFDLEMTRRLQVAP
jgi:hypothetical protein